MSGLPKIPERSVPANDQRLIDRRNGKPRRVTPKVRKAVRLMLDGSCRTMKAAAERVQVSPEYISRALRQPHVLNYVDEQARVSLAAGKMLASARLLELIHAKSEHVSFDASAHALAIAGIRAVGDPVVAVNISGPAGYVIDTVSDPREADMKTIEHQPEEFAEPEPANLAKPAAPQRAAPFPALVQTGVTRNGGPRFPSTQLTTTMRRKMAPNMSVTEATAVLSGLKSQMAGKEAILARGNDRRRKFAFKASQGDKTAAAALERIVADEAAASEAIRNLTLAIEEATRERAAAVERGHAAHGRTGPA